MKLVMLSFGCICSLFRLERAVFLSLLLAGAYIVCNVFRVPNPSLWLTPVKMFFTFSFK